MSTNSHLVVLERDLEADLAEARRQLKLGRDDAIAELNAHRGSLGALCGNAVLKIESLAQDAGADLDKVRARLGELNLLLAQEDVKDLDTFDRFRDRILNAMSAAEQDLEFLKARGDVWSERHHEISEAWHQLSRRLELARLHLVHEAELASKKFESERKELVERIEKLEAHGPEHHARGDLLAKIGKEFDRFLPGLKTVFLHPDATVPPERKDEKFD